jgi:predicted DNA binding protein
MSVILEFTIDDENFSFGRILDRPPGMHLELERVVPTGEIVMPYVWATGGDHEVFEEQVRANSAVAELLALDRIDDRVLYRIEWATRPTDLLEAIAEAGGVVLEAEGDDRWAFRLRFVDHDGLSTFHNFVLEHSLPLHVDRTYTLSEETDHGQQFGLTQTQREALVLATERGYFDVPSGTTLDELAEELGITRQALSERIRRGNGTVLREVLLSSAGDFE